MQRASAAEWKKRVERWKGSGLTAKEFATKMGFNPSTLTYWSRRLRAAGSCNPQKDARGTEGRRKSAARMKSGAAAPAIPKLVELPVAEVVLASPMLELVLRGDIRVRVPSDFDEPTLLRLVRAIEQVS